MRVTQSDGSYGELRPYAKGFRLEAEIEFEHPLIGRQSLALDIEPQTFRRELARARTFGFMRDVAKLWSAGFALGASFENTLVVTENLARRSSRARRSWRWQARRCSAPIVPFAAATSSTMPCFRP